MKLFKVTTGTATVIVWNVLIAHKSRLSRISVRGIRKEKDEGRSMECVW